MLLKETSYQGFWWIAGAQKKVPGVLEYSPLTGLKLKLNGVSGQHWSGSTLRPLLMRFSQRLPCQPRIFGRLWVCQASAVNLARLNMRFDSP